MAQALQIYGMIRLLEQQAEKTAYRGMARSRIDDSLLGNSEYTYKDWTWPQGYSEHYVATHLCRPSQEFIDFLKSECL